jgi:chorismate mutase
LPNRRLLFVAAASLLLTGSVLADRGDPARRLVSLLRERLLVARDVAKAKYNSGAPVEDRAREQAVIDEVSRLATAKHVDPQLAKAVFSAQIEASKVAQRAFLRRWAGHARFTEVPDLRREVRPKLDRLTDEILGALGAVSASKRTDLVRAAGHVAWPRQDLYAYQPAWRVAIGPFK